MDTHSLTGKILDDIRHLTENYPGRRSGSPNDHAIAEEIGVRLLACGCAVEMMPVDTFGGAYLSWCVHAALGLVPLAFNVNPGQWLWAQALSTLLALSFTLEVTGRAVVLRRLLPRLPSYNVIGNIKANQSRGAILIVSHHDAGHCGRIYRAPTGSRSTSFTGRLPLPHTEPHLYALLGILLLPLGLAARTLSEPWPLASAVWQAGWACYLCVYLYLFGEVAGWGPISPSANDNASGVAAMLALAEQSVALDILQDAPVDLYFASTAADEQGGMGIRRFLRERGGELPKNAFFLFVDTIGFGTPHYLVREGILWPKSVIPEKTEGTVLRAAQQADIQLARHEILNSYSDTVHAWRAGFQGTMINALSDSEKYYHCLADTPDNIDPKSLETALQLMLSIVREYGAEIKGSH